MIACSFELQDEKKWQFYVISGESFRYIFLRSGVTRLIIILATFSRVAKLLF